jgi:phosphoesterase RecJ-like protein
MSGKKEEWDLAIAVDCGDIRRLGKRKEIFDSAKNTINIDHHETNTKFAKINMVNKNASSVGEMLFDIIKELDEKIDRFTAMCLYVAIATDTGCFKFDSTTFRTHEIAGKLIRTGIDISDISRKLFDVKTVKDSKTYVTYVRYIEII